MAVRESLELDISSALDGVGKIGEALLSQVSAFSTGLVEALTGLTVTVPVTADAESVTTEVSDAVSASDTEATVTADASEISGDIDAAIADADATIDTSVDGASLTGDVESALHDVDATVSVDADVSKAESALGDLGDSVSSSNGPLGIFNSLLGSLEEGAGGLGESLKGLASGPVGAVVAAVAAGTAVFTAGADALIALGSNAVSAATSLQGLVRGLTSAFTSIPLIGKIGEPLIGLAGFFDQAVQGAIKADSAQRRLNNTFGEFATRFSTLDAGSFSIALTDLTGQLGLSASEAKNAAANFGILLRALPTDAVERASEQFVLLAANAIALNPALGSLADVSTGLQRALVSGNARALARFGIILDETKVKTEANAEAQREFGRAFTELGSAQQKSILAIARASSAASGIDFERNIALGAQDPTVRLNALSLAIKKTLVEAGKPLIAPFFDVLQTAQPLLKETLSSLGELGKVVVPLIGVALKVVTPLFVGFVKSIGFAAQGIGAFIGTVGEAGAILNEISSKVPGFGDVIPPGAIDAARRLGGAISGVGTAAAGTTGPVNDQTQALEEAQAAADTFGDSVKGLVSAEKSRVDASRAVADADSEIADKDRAVADAARGVADAQRSAADAHRAVGDAQKGVTQSQQELVGAQKTYERALVGVTDAERQRVDSIRNLTDAQKGLADAQRALTEAQQGPSQSDTLALDEAKLTLEEALARQQTFANSADTSSFDAREADLAVRRARLAVTDREAAQAGKVAAAQDAVVQAQRKVEEAQRGQEQASRALADANDHVAEAAQGIVDKRDAIVSAQDAVTKARLQEVDANTKIADSLRGVQKAQDEADKARADTAEKRRALAQADLDLDKQRRDLAKSLAENPAAKDQFLSQIDTSIKLHPEDKAALEAFKAQVVADIQDAVDQASEGAAAGGTSVGTQFAQGLQTGIELSLGNLPPLILDPINQATATAAAGLDFTPLQTGVQIGMAGVGQAVAGATVGFPGIALGWTDQATAQAPSRIAPLGDQYVGAVNQQTLDVSNAAQGLIPAALGWIDRVITDGPAKLDQVTSVFVGWASSLPGQIDAAIGDVSRLLFDKGGDILHGLLSGMIDAAKDLGGFFTDLKDRFVNAATGAFEAHSPARVMFPLGRDVTGGITHSMVASADQVVAAAEEIARQAAAAAVPTIDLSPVVAGASSLAIARAAAVGAPSAAQGVVMGPFTFNVDVAISGPVDASTAQEIGSQIAVSAHQSLQQLQAAVVAA